MRAVRIDWIDSCASNQGWTLMDDLGEVEAIYITSFGYVVSENEKTITIAQNKGVDPLQVCNLMTIPKGCIEKITDLVVEE